MSVARQLLGKNPHIVARQWLGRNVTMVTNIHTTKEGLLDTSSLMWPCRLKESRRLVLPGTSCYIYKLYKCSISHSLSTQTSLQ
jgi:hypothetical protein